MSSPPDPDENSADVHGGMGIDSTYIPSTTTNNNNNYNYNNDIDSDQSDSKNNGPPITRKTT